MTIYLTKNLKKSRDTQASTSEGSSISVLEAFNYGIPVLASNVSGLKNFINKKNYIVDKIFTINDLAKKISEDLNERRYKTKIYT